MNRCMLSFLILTAAPGGLLANTCRQVKDCKEFMIGVTGIHADITGGVLRVTQVTPGTPAAGKLEKGDVLEAVDGASLAIQDPRHPLGFAINAAEGRDGKMNFSIRRGMAQQTVEIQLDPIGSYSPTFPGELQKIAAHRRRDRGVPPQTGRARPRHHRQPRRVVPALDRREEVSARAWKNTRSSSLRADAGSSVWAIGYSGIFLGEYYLATGDKRVLPALQARCETLRAGQYYGGWGHGTSSCVTGYVTGGLLNAAGDQALTTLVLARECGVKVNEKTYDDALRLFFRFAGRGGVPYGDHLPETVVLVEWQERRGGRRPDAAAGQEVPGGRPVARAERDRLLLRYRDGARLDFRQRRPGETSSMCWFPKSTRTRTAATKTKVIWHFELSRMPGGGFRTPWYPGLRTDRRCAAITKPD